MEANFLQKQATGKRIMFEYVKIESVIVYLAVPSMTYTCTWVENVFIVMACN